MFGRTCWDASRIRLSNALRAQMMTRWIWNIEGDAGVGARDLQVSVKLELAC